VLWIFGSKGLKGDNYIYDLYQIQGFNKGNDNLFTVLNSIAKQAKDVGASKVTINGFSIANRSLKETVEKLIDRGNFSGWKFTKGAQDELDVIITKDIK